MSSNQSHLSGYKPSRTGDDLKKKSKIENDFKQLTGLDDKNNEKNKDTQSNQIRVGPSQIMDSTGIILGSNTISDFQLNSNMNNNNNNTSNLNNSGGKLNKSNDREINKKVQLRELIKQVLKDPKLIHSLFLLYGNNCLGTYIDLDDYEQICTPKILAKVEFAGVGNYSSKPSDEAKLLKYYDECGKANNLDKHGKSDSCRHLPQSAKKYKAHPLFKPRSTN